MNELIALNAEALQKLNDLIAKIRQKAWSEHSREGFVSALSESVEKISELSRVLEKIKKELGEAADSELQEHLLFIENETNVLKRNLEMEKKKKPVATDLLDSNSFKDHYAELEQRIVSMLLKTRFLLERLQLNAKKHEGLPANEKSTARNLLDLLKNKESEIESLKEKYSEARKQALTGISFLQDNATLEKEMNELARKLELEQSNLEKAYFESQKSLEAMQQSNIVLRQEVRRIQQAFANYLQKSFELITMLKKESDYAKKIVLDIEHETLQLRSTYTKELLSLEEAKIAAKREAEQKFSLRIKKLEQENEKNQKLLEQLQEMLVHREKKLEEFEEKNTKLRLLLQTKQKHDSAKKAFLKK